MSDKPGGRTAPLFKYNSHVAELQGWRPEMTLLDRLQSLIEGECRHNFAPYRAYAVLQKLIAEIGDPELTQALAEVEAQEGEYVRISEFREFAKERLGQLRKMVTD